MLKKYKTLFLLLFITLFCYSQDIATIKTEFIAVDADDFYGIDGFNTLYYSKDNVLFKKNSNTIFQYQNFQMGKITNVDIHNPLKIVIFYEEFNRAILVDNQLNEIQEIDFSKLANPILATAVGISGQNKLWVFNGLTQQIGLFDLKTNSYSSIGNPIIEPFVYYQTDFNNFHWIDKNKHWKFISIYGNSEQNKTIEEGLQFQFLSQNDYLFSTIDNLYYKNNSNKKSYKINIVEKSFKKFYYNNQILTIFTNQGITNYKITLP